MARLVTLKGKLTQCVWILQMSKALFLLSDIWTLLESFWEVCGTEFRAFKDWRKELKDYERFKEKAEQARKQ